MIIEHANFDNSGCRIATVSEILYGINKRGCAIANHYTNNNGNQDTDYVKFKANIASFAAFTSLG